MVVVVGAGFTLYYLVSIFTGTAEKQSNAELKTVIITLALIGAFLGYTERVEKFHELLTPHCNIVCSNCSKRYNDCLNGDIEDSDLLDYKKLGGLWYISSNDKGKEIHIKGGNSLRRHPVFDYSVWEDITGKRPWYKY